MTAGSVVQKADKLRLMFLFLLLTVAFIATVAIAGIPASAVAGNVSGTISLSNTKIKDLSNVVVWLEPAGQQKQREAQKQEQSVMRQKGKQLIPHVLVVLVGQQAEFPNQDQIGRAHD